MDEIGGTDLFNLKVLWVVEAFRKIEKGTPWCMGRRWALPVATFGANTANIPKPSGALLECTLVEGLDALCASDSLYSDASYGDCKIELEFSHDEFVLQEEEGLNFDTNVMLRVTTDTRGKLKTPALDDWAASVVTHWGAPPEIIRIQSLTFDWSTVHLPRLFVTSQHVSSSTIIRRPTGHEEEEPR